jgi:hypothetical protein
MFMVNKPGSHSEETKFTLKKDQVNIAADGHITIKDPSLIRKLTEHNIKTGPALAADDVSVGVVVSKSF